MKMGRAVALMGLWVLATGAQQAPTKQPENKPPAKAPHAMVAAPSVQKQPAATQPESCTELGYMRWSFSSEREGQPVVELLVTDPKGRRLGHDVRSNKGYEEIPRATYGLEGLDDDETGEAGDQTGVVEFCNPEPGEYQVQVFGKANGRYSLELYASSKEFPGKNGLPESVQSSAMVDEAAIKKGALQRLTVKYSREPGEKVEVVK